MTFGTLRTYTMHFTLDGRVYVQQHFQRQGSASINSLFNLFKYFVFRCARERERQSVSDFNFSRFCTQQSKCVYWLPEHNIIITFWINVKKVRCDHISFLLRILLASRGGGWGGLIWIAYIYGNVIYQMLGLDVRARFVSGCSLIHRERKWAEISGSLGYSI